MNVINSQHSYNRRILRYARIKLAILSSVASKIFGFLLQFLVVPLAIKALGPERFGIYTILVSTMAWIDLGRIGIGPGLTREIAISWSEECQLKEKQLFSTAFFILAALAITLISISSIYISIDVDSFIKVFGSSESKYRDEILIGVIFILFSLSIQTVVSCAESARSAYQEDYINNLSNCAGNLLAICSVILVAKFWPSIQGFAIAIFGSLTLSKLFNTIILLFHSRRYLMPTWNMVNLECTKVLLNSSFAFLTVQLATLMMHNFSVVLLGYIVGPDVLTPFALVFRLLQLFSTVVFMFALPLWPSITDAVVRDDYAWIQAIYVRLKKIVLSIALVGSLTIFFYGDYILRLWIGDVVNFDLNLIRIMSLYFFIWMWNSSNTYVLFGLGRLWPLAITMLFEGSLVLLFGGFLVPRFGNLGMALSFCLSGLATSAWILPLIVRKDIYSRV